MKKNKDCVIAVSYGDYTQNIGGTDKVILCHQKIFNSKGISFLQIYGVSLKDSRFPIKRNDLWGLIENGKNEGLYTTNQLCKKMYKKQQEGYEIKGFYIHHLRNVNLNELTKFMVYVKAEVYLYIHDYMTICPNRGLVNSSDVYCGNSKVSNENCSKCVYYDANLERRSNEVRKFLYSNMDRIKCIAPSVTAMNIWEKSYPDFSDKIQILPHQTLKGKYQSNRKEILTGEKIKIAFVGSPDKKKGWHIWVDAVTQIMEMNLGIELYHFGTSKDKLKNVKSIDVDFRRDPNSMINNLRENQIHIAVLWSIVPETYSYTFFEAYAANCFIIANSLSGNIARQIEQFNNGLVVDNPESLLEVLKDEKKLKEMVNAFRKSGNFGPQELVANRDILKIQSHIKEKCMNKIMYRGFWDWFYVFSYQLITRLYRRFI